MNHLEYIADRGGDSWVCLCGNEPHLYGFFASDLHGRRVEPTPDAWNGVSYVCDQCGRVIDQFSRCVIGSRKSAEKAIEPARSEVRALFATAKAQLGVKESIPECAIHHVPMNKREGKHGPFWSCSRKNADGSWCRYRPQV
jgi:hypothetical protein